MARVSVMIPTYNYGHFLGEAIQSVLDQTFQDFEIIVVDDGSTDNTREVVNSFKDTRVRYIYQDHRGVSAAQNAAIYAASGEYITGVAADDLFLPQNLEIKVKLLDSRPDVGLVYSDAYLFDNNTGDNIGRLWRDPKGSHPRFDRVKAVQQPLKELLCNGCFIMPQASMMRRQVFAAVGYYDESLPTHEDWDLIIRVVQRFPIELIDTPLLKIRRHSTNLTGSQEKMYLGAAAAANKVMRSGSLSGDELKLLKERLLPQHILYARLALLDGKEAAARKTLISGIRLEPWNIKLYVYFVLSMLGTRKVLVLRNWKKKLGRHSAGCQSSGDTSSIGSQSYLE